MSAAVMTAGVVPNEGPPNLVPGGMTPKMNLRERPSEHGPGPLPLRVTMYRRTLVVRAPYETQLEATERSRGRWREEKFVKRLRIKNT